MGTKRWLGTSIFSLSLFACDHSGPAADRSADAGNWLDDCMRVHDTYVLAVRDDAQLNGLASPCTNDSECVLWSTSAYCPAGNMHADCGRATLRTNVNASEARRTELANQTVCASDAPQCAVGASCAGSAARCVAGTCTAVLNTR